MSIYLLKMVHYYKHIVGLLFCIVLSHSQGLTVDQEYDIIESIQTGEVGPLFANIMQDLNLGHYFRTGSFPVGWNDERSIVLCNTCYVGVNQLIEMVRNGTSSAAIADAMEDLCIRLGIGNEILCHELIVRAEPELYWIVDNTPGLTGRDACGTMFVGFGCTSNNPNRTWEVTIDENSKPPIDQTPYPDPSSVPTMKILHLADIHFDPRYTAYSNVTCPEEYLCCRASNGILHPSEPEAAGQWGDYRNCDPPKATIELMFQQINTAHPDLDFIIMTGDLVPHNVWATSRAATLSDMQQTADMLIANFPGTPVFPSLGNHESHPINTFPQPYITEPQFDISWLTEPLANIWANWLPPDVLNDVSYAAYYSISIASGLRIISVNSQFCYGLNWWLIYDSLDIANELELLVSELQSAEDNGEKVYIISHISPGDRDCDLNWSHEYNRIISRYENTVVGLFYGHTHRDHFEIFYDPSNSSRPYKVGYIAQSQTPYSYTNPGYKIYHVEGIYSGSQFRVLDTENWIMDLDYANTFNDPTFFRTYNAMEEYGLVDLSPASWESLVYEMAQPNSTIFETFYRNYVKHGAPSVLEGCDDKCKSDILCRLLVSDNSDVSKCDTLP